MYPLPEQARRFGPTWWALVAGLVVLTVVVWSGPSRGLVTESCLVRFAERGEYPVVEYDAPEGGANLRVAWRWLPPRWECRHRRGDGEVVVVEVPPWGG